MLFVYIRHAQLGHEDSDVDDMSLKCLSLLVQLFGGDHVDAMSPANMVMCFKPCCSHTVRICNPQLVRLASMSGENVPKS